MPKRSAASSSSGPLEGLTFLVDESVGAKILPAVLESLGAQVLTVAATFGQGAPDVEWLTAAGPKGWIVIPRDRMIRKRPLELQALRTAGVRAFAFSGGDQTADAMGELLRLRAVKMANICRSEPAPFLYTITAAGKLGRERLR